MFKRIVVPLDGSPLAEKALPYAIEVARRFQADILLIQNVDTVFPSVPAPAAKGNQPHTRLELLLREAHEQDRRLLSAAGEYMSSKVKDVEASGVKASYQLFAHSPFHSMMEFCQKEGADLIVMTTHGRSGIKRALLGSTTDKTIRESRIPVLVIRPLNGS
ncbi:MAG: universal stress protein [Chloroflexi bacterium]|nr:universal stress protein [Chloroflexota bacterium]